MSKVCPVCHTTYPVGHAFCASDGLALVVDDTPAELIGSVIADRYLLTELLGAGAMGRVYLAHHVRLPLQAAVKVLRPDRLTDAVSVARFRLEATNASRISHECVARVHDFGETAEGLAYLAMEYVPGRTLSALLAESGALEARRAVAVVGRIAAALDAAHRLGIVHRDLKPDNVIVGERDDADIVKVVDFGMSKVFGPAADRSVTRTGFVVGTPEFMSPEQLMGEPLDARSDVYALALVARQCLTGTRPFDRATPEAGLRARFVDAPLGLRDTRPAVVWPPAVEAVMRAGLARDAEGRPSSAGEFARQLAAAVHAWRPSHDATAIGRGTVRRLMQRLGLAGAAERAGAGPRQTA